jgi:hypothetical protein
MTEIWLNHTRRPQPHPPAAAAAAAGDHDAPPCTAGGRGGGPVGLCPVLPILPFPLTSRHRGWTSSLPAAAAAPRVLPCPPPVIRYVGTHVRSINRSTDRSTDQPINQSINQSRHRHRHSAPALLPQPPAHPPHSNPAATTAPSTPTALSALTSWEEQEAQGFVPAPPAVATLVGRVQGKVAGEPLLFEETLKVGCFVGWWWCMVDWGDSVRFWLLGWVVGRYSIDRKEVGRFDVD